jgi:two-component system, chemotaxis family, chemotaxis protein CheY
MPTPILDPVRYVARYPGTAPPQYSIMESSHAPWLRENARIVIVDDDPFFRSLFKVMLAQAGLQNAEILEAEDSNRAFDHCRNKPVDLVFCDLHLTTFSSRNGLEVVQELRIRNPDLPVYMVTADNTQSLIEMVSAAGATGHLLKPISLRTVKRVLLSTLTRNSEMNYS